jgi:hypothetical protein
MTPYLAVQVTICSSAVLETTTSLVRRDKIFCKVMPVTTRLMAGLVPTV